MGLHDLDRLLSWRLRVTACRKCRLLADGNEIDPTIPDQLAQAHIHHDAGGGWARAMLDKSPEAALDAETLARSCSSGLPVVLEAPNFDDTYNPAKGYVTVDRETDETGRFTYELLHHIGLTTRSVVTLHYTGW